MGTKEKWKGGEKLEHYNSFDVFGRVIYNKYLIFDFGLIFMLQPFTHRLNKEKKSIIRSLNSHAANMSIGHALNEFSFFFSFDYLLDSIL